jgi:hypothetical protein
LRRILIVGAFAVLRQARAHPEKYPWLTQLLTRKPAKVAAVAFANETARIAWAVLTTPLPLLTHNLDFCGISFQTINAGANIAAKPTEVVMVSNHSSFF